VRGRGTRGQRDKERLAKRGGNLFYGDGGGWPVVEDVMEDVVGVAIAVLVVGGVVELSSGRGWSWLSEGMRPSQEVFISLGARW
jgi:hypothetical protein